MKPLLSVLFMGVMTLSLTNCSMDSSSTTTTPAASTPASTPPASAASSGSASQQVVAAVFSPAAGSYADPQSVTLSTTTIGATIRYTTDGSAPTETAGTRYSGPINVTASETITAIAYMTGASSSVSTAAYTIAGTVAAPTFTPAAGTFPGDQSVTISSATTGAVIFYTTDGSTPTDSSTAYSAPIPVAGNGTKLTLQAIAIETGASASQVATAAYLISYPVPAPVFGLAAGTYSSDQRITLSSATPGATIHYTTDGSPPTRSSALYSAAIPVARNGTTQTIKAIATRTGMADSPVASASYTINYSQVSTPNLVPDGGTFSGDQAVTITCATTDAAIFYTTDGSVPSASSHPYTAPIPIAGNGTTAIIKASAIKTGMTASGVVTGSYAIKYPQVSTPTFSPPEGAYSRDQAVTVSSVTPGAAIHYTTDGSMPTDSSPTYTAPIPVAGNGTSQTIRAMATKTEMLPSGVGSATYSVYNRWRAVGTQGNGINQLKYPTGLAVDAAGRLYVADYGNSRVVRMDGIGGKGWVAFGTPGGGAHQLMRPAGIAVDAAGHIYIADLGNNRVVRMDDMNGTGWTTLGVIGGGVNQLNNPAGIAVDAAGHIYIADTGNSRIVRVDDISGKGWTTLGTRGNGTNQLKNPNGVAMDADGHIFVTDYGNSRIVRRDDMGGANWTALGGAGDKGSSRRFSYPAGIAVDAGGHACVADLGNNRIVRTDMTGAGWVTVGGPGAGVYQFAGPSGIAFDAGGSVYVVDQYNCRIVRFVMP
jgi:sugar lactone lactonase YvrE